MQQLEKFAPLIARVFIGGFFLMAGLQEARVNHLHPLVICQPDGQSFSHKGNPIETVSLGCRNDGPVTR